MHSVRLVISSWSLHAILFLVSVSSAFGNSVNIEFSSYMLHNGWGSIREVAFDSHGNILVLLYGDIKKSDYDTLSKNIKLYKPSGADSTATDGSHNLMVLKLTPDGSKVIWGSILDGQNGPHGGAKGAYGIVVRNDNIYVAGTTYHDLFPTTTFAWDSSYNDFPSDGRAAHGDGYFFVLGSDGSLLYSTYIGGRGWDTIRGGLDVDSQGNVYLVGSTNSNNFLSEVQTLGNDNLYARGFIVRLSEKRSSASDTTPDNFNVDYVYYLGGNGNIHEETVTGVIVGPGGLLHIGQLGWGPGAQLTSDAWQRDANGKPTYGGGNNDFLFTILDPTSSPLNPRLHYATYLGGPKFDGTEHRITVDGLGNTYISGASSGGFPVLNAHQSKHGGGEDGVLAKFDNSGRLVFATYIGASGEGSESMFGPAIDQNGNVWVAGFTQNSTFSALTTPNALDWIPDSGPVPVIEGQHFQGGDRDIVIQQYTSDGKLLFSSLFGGDGFDYGRFVAVAPNGDIIVAGDTSSTNFPTKNALFSTRSIPGSDSFIARLSTSKKYTQLSAPHTHVSQ